MLSGRLPYFALVCCILWCVSGAPSQSKHRIPLSKATLEQLQKRYDTTRTYQIFDDSVLTPLGVWGYGPCYAVAAKYDTSSDHTYMYMGNGILLEVVDITNPSSPKRIKEVKIDYIIQDMTVMGNYLYTVSSGLTVYDISQADDPLQVSQVTPGGIRIAIRDTLAFVGTDGGAVLIFSIANPLSPQFLSWIWAGGEFTEALYPIGRYVFASTYDGLDVAVIDVSNPHNPTWANWIEMGPVQGFAADSGRLYMATRFSPRFQVFDLADTVHPRYITGIDLGLPFGLGYRYPYAFLSIYGVGLVAVDVRDTLQLHTVGTVPAGANFSIVAVRDSIVLNGTYSGALIALMSDSLRAASFVPTGGRVYAVKARGQYAYVADGGGGLWVLDVSDSMNPHGVGHIGTHQPTDLILEDNYAYLAANGGLWIVDITDPTNPTDVSYTFVNGRGWIAKSGHYVYASDFIEGVGFGFTIVDVSNPYQPDSIGRFNVVPDAKTYRIAVKESYAYLCTLDGLKIIDVSNPTQPQEVNQINRTCDDILIVGHYAFVRADSFLVIDITNPIQSRVISTIPEVYGYIFGSTGNIAAVGNMICFRDGVINIYDVSSPATPVLVYPSSLSGSNVHADRNKLYVGLGDNIGLMVVQNNLEQSYQYNFSKGWNMLSLPIPILERQKNNLFPTAVSDAYFYRNGYVRSETLAVGVGYWLKFDSPQSGALYGLKFSTDTINVNKGWNMIGSIGEPVPIATITSIPPGIVISDYYTFIDNAYSISDTIFPFKAYWVKVSETGKLILSSQ